MSTVARAEFKRAKVDRIWSRVAVRRINLRKLANVSFLLPATAVSVYRVRSNNAPEFRVIHHGKLIAWSTRVSKRFVYVLTNDESPPKYYTGLTSDVLRRCAEHNAGSCTQTAKHRPWSVDVVIEFADDRRAVAFERYLKTGSGVAFANRHLR